MLKSILVFISILIVIGCNPISTDRYETEDIVNIHIQIDTTGNKELSYYYSNFLWINIDSAVCATGHLTWYDTKTIEIDKNVNTSIDVYFTVDVGNGKENLHFHLDPDSLTETDYYWNLKYN